MQSAGRGSLLPHVTKCLQEASSQPHMCVTVTVHLLSKAAGLGTAIVIALHGLLCDREGRGSDM